MHYKSLIATGLLAAGVVAETGKLGDAQTVNDNPKGKTYVAEFDCETATGSIYFTATESGKGVDVEVDMKSIKGYTGPFGYHIHDQPVDATGDCASTKAHLDPYQRGQATPCDKTKPETCEVGDLAGKHGKIEALPYMKEYVDLYASTKEGIGAFLGNRSIVIHASDEKKTRIACTNLVLVEMSDDEEECESSAAPSYPSATPAYPASPEKPVEPCYGPNCPKVTPSPEKPSYPGKSEHPVKPQGPAYPEHPEAETPAYPTPALPSEVPVHPEHPAYPSKPETPVYPGKPETPVYPSKPAHPEAPAYPSKPAHPEAPAYPSKPAHPEAPVYPESPVYPSKPVHPEHPVVESPVCYGPDCAPASPQAPPCYGAECPTTLVPVYPGATGSPAPPTNATSPYPPVYTKPATPAQYTGSASAFGVSSFLAAVGAIAALVVVV